MPNTPRRALVVTPHPDDGEIGCGGTVARWIQNGCVVFFVLCTDGGKGSNDPSMTSSALAIIRKQEQWEANVTLGVKELVALDYPDGELEDIKGFRKDLVRAIRRFQPDVVLTTDPFRSNSYIHRDHRMCGQVTLDAVFPYARDRMHFPDLLTEEGLHPHKVAQLMLWGSQNTDTYVDITETISLKIKALLCHTSQMAANPDWDANASLRRRASEIGTNIGVQYAEAFRTIRFN